MNIGVDIENISRFQNKTLENDEAFLNRVYTKNELDYCFSTKNPAPHLAARYCAKEAVVKAVSNIYGHIISYNLIEILKNPNGSPYVNILVEDLKKYSFSLSLSHDKEKAIAFVIVE